MSTMTTNVSNGNGKGGDNQNCKAMTVDLIAREGDVDLMAIQDEVVADLSQIGVTVNVRFLPEDEYLRVETNGDYNLLFTKTWGAPYDPHSYLTSWETPSHVEYSAIKGLEPPLTRDVLFAKINKVQTLSDTSEIRTQWREILNDIHQQAMFLPLWGSRVPYIVNRRLSGFVQSYQTLTYPINTVVVESGSRNVTVAPGTAGTLFTTVGPINPHSYSPNEFFASNWVYEGLVSFGQDGEIVPALATSWTTEDDTTTGGQRVTFVLRQNVLFHDDTPWNCQVAVLNFDHVLSDKVRGQHSWYGTGKFLTSWECNANGDLVLSLSQPFYPLLQELTYSRPLVFASAAAFMNGTNSHPDTHNSCLEETFGAEAYASANVKCVGLQAPIGTGPLKYHSRDYLDPGANTTDKRVVFAAHTKYWGTVPGFDFVEVRHFESTALVEAALRDGTLDMVLGSGPLTAKQVVTIEQEESATFEVHHSDVFQHAVLVLNTGRVPTNDIATRQAMIHAINKAPMIDSELSDLEQPVTQLLPYSAPYCNVDLNPKWSYDLEKAQFLNCPRPTGNKLSTGAKVGISIAGLVIVLLATVLAKMVYREKEGKPIFSPVRSGSGKGGDEPEETEVA